jgi:osmoprotectant transport system ATP-binding protein
MIRFHRVGKSFGSAVALQPTDLEIPAQKRTVIIGPSGSRKSTILRLISGLIEPTTGRIEINGQRLAPNTLSEIRLRMGYVIQSGDLFPHLTARHNILLVAQEVKLPTPGIGPIWNRPSPTSWDSTIPAPW